MDFQTLSDDFNALMDGYFEYANEVVTNRAIPDVRDGLKKVQRRIIYSMLVNKQTTLAKSNTVVGNVSSYHPHGEASIYNALILMADSHGLWSVPFIQGHGNFGKSYLDAEAAAPRYTDACLNAFHTDLVRDLEAVDFVPKENGDNGVEPSVLPARYPNLLMIAHDGMAIGLGTSTPSFNFWDVLDLTETYLKEGSFQDKVIYPDFASGGTIYISQRDAVKLMHSGSASYTMRPSYEIDGNVIDVFEMVPNMTAEKMEKSIRDLINSGELEGVRSAVNASGLQTGCSVKIFCQNKSVVDEVEAQLYRKGILQSKQSAYMVWYNGSDVFQQGVYGVITEWVSFRRKVVHKLFTNKLKAVKDELSNLEYFIQLVDHPDWRDTFIDKVVNANKSEALEYLSELFSEIAPEESQWIYERRVSSFNKVNKYRDRYNTLLGMQDEYQGYLDNIDGYILKDLAEIKAEHAGLHERNTMVSATNIVVSSKSSNTKVNKPVDNRMCTFVYDSNGLIYKTMGFNTPERAIKISGKASDTLIGFDRAGRLLRVYGDDLEFDNPVAIQTYLGTVSEPNNDIVYLMLMDGRDYMITYADGYVSWLRTSEFVGKRRYKVIQRGVPIEVRSFIMSITPVDPEVKQLVWRYGNVMAGALLDEIREPKNMTTRVRAITGLEDFATSIGFFKEPLDLDNVAGEVDVESLDEELQEHIRQGMQPSLFTLTVEG